MDSKTTPLTRRNLLLLGGGLILGSILGFIILLSDGLYKSPAKLPPMPEVGQPLSTFTLEDTTGKTYDLAELKGKPVIINFWASWCKPCEKEMPLLNQAATELNGSVVVLGVDSEDNLHAITEFGKKWGLAFPLLVDSDSKVTDQYNVVSYPTTFFIDQDGVLRAIQLGELDAASLSDYLKQIGITQ